MAVEHRAGGELRLAGRTLTGTAMRYGDVSPGFRERFVSGAFSPVPATLPINLQHDPSVVVAEAAALTDSPEALRVRAELPEGSAALALVRRGALRSYSVEFHSRSERREAGIRVVERATLAGLALCDEGAYPQAKAETRARSGRTVRSSIPYDRELACECIARGGAGAECVPLAKFAKVAGGAMDEIIAAAFETARRGDTGPDVLAVAKDYSRPLASARRGTLRAADGDEGLEVEIDLPTGAAGAAVEDAHEAAGVIVRPLIDEARSEFRDGPDGREYTRPHLRAFLVGSTDARSGWPEAVIALKTALPDPTRPIANVVDKFPVWAPTPAPVPRPDDEERSASRRRSRAWLL